MEDIKNTEINESSMVDSAKETTETNVATEETKEKTFTQEELEKIISKRLDRERKKAEEEKAEAERLATMSADERAKAEFEKDKAEFERQKKEFQRQELELQMIKELTTKNLPIEFVRYIMSDTAEGCMENIKIFELRFTQAVEKAVQQRLTTGYVPPQTSKTTVKNPWSREHLNLTEQAKIYRENPALAEQLKASANK